MKWHFVSFAREEIEKMLLCFAERATKGILDMRKGGAIVSFIDIRSKKVALLFSK